MADPEALCQAVPRRLSRVSDPETGVDVVRMRMQWLKQAIQENDSGCKQP
jgi:metal-sulfur cluster biosynthetic enzyme